MGCGTRAVWQMCPVQGSMWSVSLWYCCIRGTRQQPYNTSPNRMYIA